MAVYIVATVISMIFASLAAYSKRSYVLLSGSGILRTADNGYAFFSTCSAIPLILVAALRHEVGTDWPIYSEFFESINNGTEFFGEFGFNLLNIVVHAIYPDFALMVAVTSIIMYTLVFKAIYDQSINYSFSILFFVIDSSYFNGMNQLRQMLTVAIFLYALKYIKQKRFIAYLVCILIAMTIHTSAILFLPIYFLYGFRVNVSVHVITLMLGAVLMVPLNSFVNFIISKTSYSWYLDSIYVEYTGLYLIGFVFSVVIMLFYDFYFCYGEDKEDKDYNFYANMQWLATLMLFFTESVPQASRIILCFSATILLGMPKLILREKNFRRRLVLIIILVVLFITKLLYDVYQNNWYEVIPYQTIFER